jgi:predicted Zn-dependent protease
MDPPPWWFPERRSLAAALLAAGRPAEAVVEARKALAGWPHDPLSLQVLGEAETAAGDTAAGERDLAEARQTWRGGTATAARL